MNHIDWNDDVERDLTNNQNPFEIEGNRKINFKKIN